VSDIVERLRNYIPGEHEEFVPEVNALAIAEIEQLRRDLAHAKAVQAVRMNRARKAEALSIPQAQRGTEP
jgi:hypothetical protein